MNHRIAATTLALLFICSILNAQPVLNKLFSSGIYNGNQIDILVNGPAGTSAFGFVDGDAFDNALTPAWDTSNWQWGTITNPSNGYLGFWYPLPEYTINPLFHPGTQDPELSYYTSLGTDPMDDNIFPSSSWLDLWAYESCFSEERLYFAMYNNGGSYPISSGTTFFAYMPVLVDPDADPTADPIVFGLMYTVSVPGVISPGLYKISGTGFSGLTRIGDIVTSIQDGCLLLSCARADLLADPDFNSWFDSNNPRVVTTATTSRISLVSGIQQADTTEGRNLVLRPQAIPFENLYAPMLSAPELVNGAENLLIPRITYFDQDANFPRIASFSIDGGEEYPLSPVNLGTEAFDAPVVFSSAGIPEPSEWNDLRFRFSHGDGFIYQTITNGSGIADENINDAPVLSISPNPVQGAMTVKNSIPETMSYAIYNLKGQKVKEIRQEGNSELKLDTSQFLPGIYFLKPMKPEERNIRFVKL